MVLPGHRFSEAAVRGSPPDDLAETCHRGVEGAVVFIGSDRPGEQRIGSTRQVRVSQFIDEAGGETGAPDQYVTPHVPSGGAKRHQVRGSPNRNRAETLPRKETRSLHLERGPATTSARATNPKAPGAGDQDVRRPRCSVDSVSSGR